MKIFYYFFTRKSIVIHSSYMGQIYIYIYIDFPLLFISGVDPPLLCVFHYWVGRKELIKVWVKRWNGKWNYLIIYLFFSNSMSGQCEIVHNICEFVFSKGKRQKRKEQERKKESDIRETWGCSIIVCSEGWEEKGKVGVRGVSKGLFILFDA